MGIGPRSEEGSCGREKEGGYAAGAGRTGLSGERSRQSSWPGESFPSPTAGRSLPGNSAQGLVCRVSWPPRRHGDPSGRQQARNRGRSNNSWTDRRAAIRGLSGSCPRLQVFLGAAAMGEPVLGAEDQPPLLPRPPRSRGPSPRARSRPAASSSRAAGPPSPRRGPELCL